MKPLIDLGGTLTHCEITYYFPEKYCIDWDAIDVDKVMEDGYDCVIHVLPSVDSRHGKFARHSSKTPLVWINALSPKAVVKPACNCEYTLTRHFTLCQWIEYGVRCLIRGWTE